MNIIEIVHANAMRERAEIRCKELHHIWQEEESIKRQKAKNVLDLQVEQIKYKIKERAERGKTDLDFGIYPKQDSLWENYIYNVDEISQIFKMAGYKVNYIQRREGYSYYQSGQVACFQIRW